MAWDTEMVRMLRYMIDDVCEPNKYADSRLSELILVSAQFVKVEVQFSTQYVIDVDMLQLSPDPTTSGARDDNFINLVTMKAACILDMSEAKTAAGKGFSFKENTSSVDLRGIMQGKLTLLEKGWCALYAQAKIEYLTNSNEIAGAAICTPFKMYATGYYSDTNYFYR